MTDTAEPINRDHLRAAIYATSVAHNWAETLDTEDRTEEIAARYDALAAADGEAIDG